MKISELITPDRVVARIAAPNRRQVIKELSRIAAESVGLNRDDIFEAVVSRRGSMTIGLGRGTAIPHATVRGIDRPVGVFARLDPAVDFEAVDGIPADIVMLVLAPEGDERPLLVAMSCVARSMRDSALVSRLRTAKDAEALYLLLTSDAWQGAEPALGEASTGT
ncbi:MAG: PTS sugar transporter subunit IIA [Pseudomonadota bacterium]|jgi:Phosphotransferase system mannitol/fructose-specific IIA domain (Ntr-type)